MKSLNNRIVGLLVCGALLHTASQPLMAADGLKERLAKVTNLVEGSNTLVVGSNDTITVYVEKGVPVMATKNLFDAMTKQAFNTAILEYIEQAYAYNAIGVKDPRFSGIRFVRGKWADLRNLPPQVPFSVNNTDAKMMDITWQTARGDVQVRFPIQYSKLQGGSRSDIENNFLKQLQAFVPLERATPSFDGAKLKKQNENLYYVPGATYLRPEVNRNIYLQPDSDGVARILFSDAYPVASMSNYMIVGRKSDNVMVELTVLKHEYGEQQTVTIPLESLIQCSSKNGCVAYWGVDTYEDHILKGSLFLYNATEGYDHVVRIECDTREFPKTKTLKGTASLYIPTNNVQNLFKQYNEKLSREKIKY